MHLEEIVPSLRELVSLTAVSWNTNPAATRLGNMCSVQRAVGMHSGFMVSNIFCSCLLLKAVREDREDLRGYLLII